MKKPDSQLSEERLEAENAALLLEVVDSILKRLDPSAVAEPDPQHPLQIANAHVRLAMACLTAALTGEDSPPPSSLFGYLARIFREQALTCRGYEDEIEEKKNGNPPGETLH